MVLWNGSVCLVAIDTSLKNSMSIPEELLLSELLTFLSLRSLSSLYGLDTNPLSGILLEPASIPFCRRSLHSVLCFPLWTDTL